MRSVEDEIVVLRQRLSRVEEREKERKKEIEKEVIEELDDLTQRLRNFVVLAGELKSII